MNHFEFNCITTGKGNEIIQINNAKITWRNFSGKKFNDPTRRSFGVIIPHIDIARELEARGWPVNHRPSNNPGEPDILVMPVKFQFNDYPPIIRFKAIDAPARKLTAESVAMLDNVGVDFANMDLSLYKSPRGVSAYLKNLIVYQKPVTAYDRFAEEECPEEEPF